MSSRYGDKKPESVTRASNNSAAKNALRGGVK